MSRIGKLSINVPDKVNVIISPDKLSVKGPKGELSRNIPNAIKVVQNDKLIQVLPSESISTGRQLYGTYRSLISNMIQGVTEGFQKKLELQGVGYRSQLDGKNLILNVGYSHQVKIISPDGIKLAVENNTNITVSGADKELVGQIAANIRAIRPPEPYKGKGISNHIYAQLIDDVHGKTILSSSTIEKSISSEISSTNTCEASVLVGKSIAKKSLEAKIEKVVFDRGGRIYHGRIRALAEAAREAGLKF